MRGARRRWRMQNQMLQPLQEAASFNGSRASIGRIDLGELSLRRCWMYRLAPVMFQLAAQPTIKPRARRN